MGGYLCGFSQDEYPAIAVIRYRNPSYYILTARRSTPSLQIKR